MIRALLAAGIAVAAATATLNVSSEDIAANGAIAKKFVATRCGGENHSPSLAWSDAPKGTASFAMIMHDPDAPIPGGFYHWVVYNLPASTHSLAGDAKLDASQMGATSLQTTGYHGPCPPSGPAHHYNFTVYALDVPRIAASSPPSGPDLERLMAGHILASGVLTGTYSR